MQEYMKKRDHIMIPSFGNWDSFDELEITQYFESARQAGLIREHSFRNVEADMYIVVPPSPLPYYHYRKLRRQQRRHGRVKLQRKQGRVFNEPIHPPRRNRAPRAVDEDLYEIPSDLIHQKTKKMWVLTDLWKRCMRLDCVP